MAQVRLENIGKRWDTKGSNSKDSNSKDSEGIREINLEVTDGEFLVLVGPSGCGKSTILRMIAGLETPSEGNIYIGDRLVNQVPARQRDVAMVFQNYALYPHMTVAENLTFGLKMRNADTQTLRDRLKTVSRSLGIEHLLQRKPAQLSGGQQQRVALGRVMARSPQVFLFDEPLSNLDAQLRDDTRAELKLLHQQLRTTTIYVTHDQTEAMTLGDRLVVLEQGKICQIGTPLEIYQNPQNLMVATFLGSPAMNILPVVYQSGKLIFGKGEQKIPCPSHWNMTSLTSQPYLMGIRPEHLKLAQTETEFSLNLRLLVTEVLGSEVLVRCCLREDWEADGNLRNTLRDNSPIQFKVANLDFTSELKPGGKVAVEFSPEHLFLFSSVNGDRLHL
jgi:multiple sugar transport system ATP-binding protein